MNFSKAIQDLSEKISLNWLEQYGKEPEKTQEYHEILQVFPELTNLFNAGYQKDSQEYSRTLSHTFHTIAVHNRINSLSFPESGLEDINALYKLSNSIREFNPLTMPLILWLHDIGKLEDTRDHTTKSAEIIKKWRLLRKGKLSEEEILLITKVIQYHLLIGPLYSGETTYMAFGTLLEDEEFFPVLREKKLTEVFVNALVLFTMIDIWAYPYNTKAISASKIENYLRIGEELKSILNDSALIDEVYERLEIKAKENLDWRFYCFMRAFALLGAKPHLTLQFYREKVLDGAGRYLGKAISEREWEEFKEKNLGLLYKVQFRYALATICSLAFGSTSIFREPWLPQHPLNPRIFALLVSLNEKISLEERRTGIPRSALWNVVFIGTPNFFKKTDLIERLNEPGAVEALTAEGRVEEGKNYSLYLDLSPYWRYLE